MTKPSSLPEWDTTQVNITTPDAQHKAEGWLAPAGTPEKPSFEYFNQWMNHIYRWIKAWNDDGLPNWDNTTGYAVGAICTSPTDGQIYRSILTPNVNHEPSISPTYWISEFGYNTTPESSTADLTFGKLKIDGRFPDNATISHYSLTGVGGYALTQESNGATSLNSIAGQNLTFQIGNATAGYIDSNRHLVIRPDEDVTTILGRSAFSSPAGDWAMFSHYDQIGSVAGYAVGQSTGGQTNINAAAGQAIHFNIGNVNNATIDSGGNWEWGTWHGAGATNGLALLPDTIFGPGLAFSSATNTTPANFLSFFNVNGQVGQIRSIGSTTSYITSSDPRLKSKFTKPRANKIEKIISDYASCAGEFHFLSDKEKTKVLGFNAHKVLDLNYGSEMGTEGKGTRAGSLDGETVTPAGVDQSKAVPALVLASDMIIKKAKKYDALIDLLVDNGTITKKQAKDL